MNWDSKELRVGIFSLAGLCILAYMFFFLSPETFQSSGRSNYYSIFKDAAGVLLKTQVKTNGVVVGKVSQISLLTNSTRIDIEINKEVKIPVGSTVTVKEKGLLGDVFLEIIRTEDKNDYIKDKDMIPQADQAGSLSGLVSMASDIGKDIKEITSSLANAMGTTEGKEKIFKFVDNLTAITSDIREVLANNKVEVTRVVHNLDQTLAILKEAVGTGPGDIRATFANVRDLTAEIKTFSRSLNEVLNPENKEHLKNTLASLDVALDKVKNIATKIDKGEGTIGRLVNNDSAAIELEDTLKDVRSILSPAIKTQIDMDYHGELHSDKETKHFFNVWFRTKSDKAYLLGFTQGKDVKVVQTEDLDPESTMPGGRNPIRTREITEETGSLRFNLQFAKRWYALQGRFGLFESTGGLAVDMFLLDDRLKMTLEAFDWNSKSLFRKIAHFKTYASWTFLNHLYVMVGADDWTRVDPTTGVKEKDPVTFVGGGFSFTDDDIKSIFGLATIATTSK